LAAITISDNLPGVGKVCQDSAQK